MSENKWYPRPGENEEAFLYRIGTAKDLGTFEGGWQDVADLCNRFYREDETTWRTESSYRKRYADFRALMNSGAVEDIDLEEQLQEIKKEKQKLSDERAALNRKLRDAARGEENLAILEKAIEENGRTTLPPCRVVAEESDNDLIVCLSDIHLGLDVKNNFGAYNSAIAERYMEHYLQKIREIQNRHHSENCVIAIIGDLISGSIHTTVRLENRENVIEQVQKVSEMVANFAYELSKTFATVTVDSVAGNHSRIGKYSEVLRDERLDDIPLWYMKAKLAHIDNIRFVDDNIDSTIGCFELRGQKYWITHGDMEAFTESGMSKLVMMIGYKPCAILTGHMHHCSYDDLANVKLIRSGSFSGTADDYCVSKRISGHPSQMVCVADKDGIQALYPVVLK